MPVCSLRFRHPAPAAPAAQGALHAFAALAAVGVLALAAGCRSDTMAPQAPANPALSAAQAQALGSAMSADAEGELDGVTASGGLFAPGMAAMPFGSGPTLCMPTRSPTPVVNSDGDPVPDSVRVSFPGCVFSEGDEADTVRGTIDVIDPTPTLTDHALKLVYTDFTRIEVEDGHERSIVLNGAREAVRNASTIALSETNFTTDLTFADGTTSHSDRNWSATFTADVAGSIQPDMPLPSGTLDISGTATWTRAANTFALMVSTSPVLHYNASCTVRPKFDAGTLDATVTRNGTTSNVTIQFTACGQFTVTRS